MAGGSIGGGGSGPLMGSPIKRVAGGLDRAEKMGEAAAAALQLQQQLQLQQLQRRQHRRRRRRGEGEDVVLLTLMEFDPRARVRLGGLVTAKSVKYLGKLASKKADEVGGFVGGCMVVVECVGWLVWLRIKGAWWPSHEPTTYPTHHPKSVGDA